MSILMHQRRVLKKVIYRMRGFCLSHVLQQWKNVVSKQARHGDVRMKVDSRVKKLCVLQALQTWQERVIWRRFLTAFRLKMVKTIHRRCLMNGFMRWEEAKWLNDDDKRKDKMQKLCRLQDLSRLKMGSETVKPPLPHCFDSCSAACEPRHIYSMCGSPNQIVHVEYLCSCRS